MGSQGTSWIVLRLSWMGPSHEYQCRLLLACVYSSSLPRIQAESYGKHWYASFTWIMSHFLTPVQSINFVTITYMCTSFWIGAKRVCTSLWTEQVSPKSHIGQKERAQVVGSHESGNNARAARAGSSPGSGCNKFQDGFSLLRNCSDGSPDVLTDRGMLVGPCA